MGRRFRRGQRQPFQRGSIGLDQGSPLRRGFKSRLLHHLKSFVENFRGGYRYGGVEKNPHAISAFCRKNDRGGAQEIKHVVIGLVRIGLIVRFGADLVAFRFAFEKVTRFSLHRRFLVSPTNLPIVPAAYAHLFSLLNRCQW